MDEKYFAKKTEAKWQKKWGESNAFAAEIDEEKPKFYQLEMLPYPSGNLHMGHVRNYSAGDALAWYKRLKGFNVLHPIGWDSFGQPAEDAAVKRGVNPRKWTEDNINAMRGQLERLGISYDWSRQMYAHKPEYYKFDQWFFIKMFEMGLAYKKMTRVNWCEHDQATLSNEQASGGICWRCGNPVTKKDLEQWFLKTTAYADQLIDDIEEIEAGWPGNVIKRQRDWIGRSDGAYVEFQISNSKFQIANEKASSDSANLESGITNPESVRIFTTRIDTIYGANAVVVAAEHPIIEAHLNWFPENAASKIAEMRAAKLRPAAREEELEKDGVDTGLKAINPFSGEELPVWVGNYIMMEYGTGAVMSVPAHDERDFEFAKKFGLPIKTVIERQRLGDAEDEFQPQMDKHGSEDHSEMRNPEGEIDAAFTDYGTLVNSGEWSGKTSEIAKAEMANHAHEQRFGEAATTYRLRDWGISRQRFWGSPIPIIYCGTCGAVPEKYENLPVQLPDAAPITGTGESPLAKVPEFYETTCPKCDRPAHRETDTMDTFVDSSWYFFRYTDPTNEILPFAPEVAAYWTPVDQYIGGDDHAVMHLIYARFWSKVMRDMELVKFDEPIKRLLTQGMVVGETFFDNKSGKRTYYVPADVTIIRDAKGRITEAKSAGTDLRHSVERMSKSKGNGVDPDEMVEIYGADAARIFIMFAAPIENELVWNEAGIEGGVRFLQRVWRLVYRWKDAVKVSSSDHDTTENQTAEAVTPNARKLRRKTHQTIKRISENFENLQFNTPVAALMELSNTIADFQLEPEAANEDDAFAVREAITSLVLMLAPFAPHTAEELFSVLVGNENGMLANGARFPESNEELAKADEIEIPVQINGKLRSRVVAAPDTANDEIQAIVFADERVKDLIAGKDLVKVVVVPNRLVNIVVKS
jgi:leucyl-tRNA synthetase